MGARGVAQLMPKFLEYFERYNDGRPIDPHDPETAVRVGIRYLAALHAELRTWRAAVGAYNCGLARWRRGDLPDETRRHVRMVMDE